jgi:hypothetical protein
MSTTLNVFISSKMQELKPEREALCGFLKTLNYGDITLHAWVFGEDAPASSRTIREIYLQALQNSALYVGILWNEFGEWTVDELKKATEWGIERHLYIKDVDSHSRSPQLSQVLDAYNQVNTGITTKWFTDIDGLKARSSSRSRHGSTTACMPVRRGPRLRSLSCQMPRQCS